MTGDAQITHIQFTTLPHVDRQRTVLDTVQRSQYPLLLLGVQGGQQLRAKLLRSLKLEVGIQQTNQTLKTGAFHRSDGQTVRYQRPGDVIGQLLFARVVPVPHTAAGVGHFAVRRVRRGHRCRRARSPRVTPPPTGLRTGFYHNQLTCSNRWFY